MIGVASRGASFHALGGYLTLGANRRSPERVDWVETRNLSTQTPRTAAHIMSATAELSKRVQKPVYHLIVSWHEKDAPTPQAMSQVMDATLSKLGLDDHQALLVAHNDCDHPHLHAMVNRVHPETGKAWNGGHDHHALRDVLREQEISHGFIQTPKHSQGTINSATKEELAIAQREDRSPGARMDKHDALKLRKDLAHSFETSADWEDLDQRLTRRRLDLKTSGNGLRVFKGDHYAKLSDLLPPKMNVKKLYNRLGDIKAWKKKKQQSQATGMRRRRQRSRQRSKVNSIDICE